MIKDLWQYLKAADKPIVLYGMGNGADKIIKVLEEKGISFAGVFATDGFVRDKYFHGFKLSTYAQLKETYGDMIVLLCFGSGRAEVLENIRRISAEQELYAPDVPVYGDGLFDLEYARAHRSDLEYAYSRLADEKSRQTFENVIKYKISGELKFLYECAVDENEPYSTFLRLDSNESFLDLGAYTGDTVRDFLSRVADYKSITAVEPDKKSFKKLSANTAEISKIKIINACVSNTSGKAEFAMRGGRNSGIGTGEEIRAVTVDEVAENASLIKMDIEGAELNAIAGAKETILKNRPKMQIACYHRTNDLAEIIKAVDGIRTDYKIYLRHYPCVPAWDLNYFFI